MREESAKLRFSTLGCFMTSKINSWS